MADAEGFEGRLSRRDRGSIFHVSSKRELIVYVIVLLQATIFPCERKWKTYYFFLIQI